MKRMGKKLERMDRWRQRNRREGVGCEGLRDRIRSWDQDQERAARDPSALGYGH